MSFKMYKSPWKFPNTVPTATTPTDKLAPTYQNLSSEPWELFTKHYSHIGTVQLALQSRRLSHLWMDLHGNFEFNRNTLSSSKVPNLVASNLDSGFFIQNPRKLGPLQLDLALRAALMEPLISGSILSFMGGSWYRLDGQCDFEANSTDRSLVRQFQTSGVLKLGPILLGNRYEFNKSGQLGKREHIARYCRADGLSLLVNLSESDASNPYQQPLISLTLGLFQRVNSVVIQGLQVDFSGPRWDRELPTLTFGAAHQINEQNLVKGKMNSHGVIGLSYVYRFELPWSTNRFVTGSISGLFNAKSFGVRFGFGLKLKE